MTARAAPLVIRADAGAAMGTGHVMRCLALAAAWPGPVHFVSSGALPSRIEARIQELGFGAHAVSASAASAEDAERTAEIAGRVSATWIVVDGYHFDGAYEEHLAARGHAVLAVDDFGHTRHAARLVLNQSLDATAALYGPLAASQELLVGPEFALLRQEFWAFRDAPPKPVAPFEKALVTLGGSDPGRVAPRVIRALEGSGLKVRLLLGGADPAGDETERLARAGGHDVVRDARDVPEHMAWADFAVASAGVTLLELLFMGTPSLLVIVAENQRAGAHAAEARDLACVLGWHADLTEERIREGVRALVQDPQGARARAARGRAAVDGRGAERVCQRMMALAEPSPAG